MAVKIFSGAVVGLDARVIEVEVDLFPGLYCFNIVGLPDMAVQESKERISSAIKNSGLIPPHRKNQRIVVNLAPADLKKQGPAYDLPIAIGFLLASGQLAFEPEGKIFIGELALDGKIRPCRGVLPIALAAKKNDYETIFVPRANAQEAGLVKNLKVMPVDSLKDLLDHLGGRKKIMPVSPVDIRVLAREGKSDLDFAWIRGQDFAKRALEIAASGGHNVLMKGAAGSGKTLLARSLPSILPEMNWQEIIEVTKIFSVAGILPDKTPLVTIRPFRSPHHTGSAVSLVGGGSWPKPGEVSLAHRGVLFLDELPEFARASLEALRQPLEDGLITVSRAQRTLTFPAKFMLVAAMNPCPCGNFGISGVRCRCSPSQITKYQKRISGPLLDRIDLFVEVPPVEASKLSSGRLAEESRFIKERISASRVVQARRFKEIGRRILTNSEMNPQEIKKYCPLKKPANHILLKAIDQFHLSARGFSRVLKLSRTIADLNLSSSIEVHHIAEALQYRPKEEMAT